MKIVGYILPNSKLPNPFLLTHINFSFGEIYMKNNVYQKIGIHGGNNELQRVVDLKNENPNLKVLLSITSLVELDDNKRDGGFSQLSQDPYQRQLFIIDCLELCNKFNLDGIDLNWEFPTISWNGQTPLPNDIENFTLLVKEMRDIFKDKLITIATHVNAKYMNIGELEKYVDFFNVMCYDLGEGEKFQYHNAIDDQYFNIMDSIKIYKNILQDTNKYVMGIPLYIRYNHKTKYTPINKVDFSNPNYIINKGDVIPFLYEIVDYKLIPIGSFEDEESIKVKSNIIRDNNLGGFMIWNLAHDIDDKYLIMLNNSLIIKENV
jgi:GH18 family chitinase